MVREAISLALTAVLTAAAADLRVSSLSDGVAIDPLFVGLNNDSSLERDPWTSETVRAALTKTRSGTLRYPGGTPGNYWDMRGQVMFQPGAAVDLARGIHTQTRYTMGWVASVSPVRQPNTVEELAKAYAEMKKAGPAGIIFTLNMITPGADYYAALWGRAVNQSPGSADWWAMLDDRYARDVEMLDRAQAAGIPIRYIEFGNEYHFGAGPGGSATAGAVVEPYSAGTWTTPPITGAFPDDGRAYADAVNAWAKKLVARYPGVRMSAVATTDGGGPRPENWNRVVVPLIDAKLVPAVSLHFYGVIREGNVTSDERALALAVASWQQHWTRVKQEFAIPADREWWISEYSSLECIGKAGCDMGAPQPWGRGLHAAAMLDSWLRDGQGRLSSFHQFRQGILAARGPEISAMGRVLSLFSLASRGAMRARRLVLNDVPLLAGADVAAVFGCNFDMQPGNRSATLLVNLSGAAHTALLPGGGTWRRGTAPLSATADPGESTGASDGSLELPPFSITVVEHGPATVPVRAADYRGDAVAADSIATVFGTGWADGPVYAAELPLPTTLGGLKVRVQATGAEPGDAGLFFASPGQINFHVPAGVPAGVARVDVMRGEAALASGLVRVDAAAPALFTANSSGTGRAAGYVTRDNAGHVYASLFGTGFRGEVTARAGGQDALVTYAGPSGYVGLDQVNVRLPDGAAGEVELRLSVGGRGANPVTVAIE